jgi:hypothetical protein
MLSALAERAGADGAGAGQGGRPPSARFALMRHRRRPYRRRVQSGPGATRASRIGRPPLPHRRASARARVGAAYERPGRTAPADTLPRTGESRAGDPLHRPKEGVLPRTGEVGALCPPCPRVRERTAALARRGPVRSAPTRLVLVYRWR